MKRIIKVFAIILGCIILAVAGIAIYIKAFLPNIGKAPDLKIERTATRIERGNYLANYVTVCMDCHGVRRWNLYAGPMNSDSIGSGGEAFTKEMGFPGNFYAPNITPYHIGAWTDGELYRAITGGVNKEGKALFPLMGYHRFGKMADEDIHSIIAYLRTLAPVKKDIPPSEPAFPVSILINTMPKKGTPGAIPGQQDKVAYGGYIINAAGCVDCHSHMDKGEIVAGTEFGGGMEFKMPGGIVRSANITYDKETGLGTWTEAAFLSRFKQYADSSYHIPAVVQGEINTPMPWNMYAGMKEEDLAAIYAYLKNVKPIKNTVVKFEAGK